MKVSLLCFVLLFVVGGAQAQSRSNKSVIPPLDEQSRKGDMARLAQKQAVEKFDQADKNKDGKLTKEELADTLPYMAEKFDRLDKDKDGFLNWEEFVGHNRWKKE